MNIQEISVEDIVPSPYQPRKSFNEEKIKDLAENIKKYGLIHPIKVRKIKIGYELLAGERRLKAVKENKEKTIRAEAIKVDDETARGIVLSENIKREDLSTVEKTEAYAMWIDYAMLSCPDYLPALESSKNIDTNNPLQRISWLMMKLDSDRRNKTDYYSNNFIRIIEKAMRGLPEYMEWQSFYINDLKKFLNTDEDVKEIAIDKKLNKSEINELQNIKNIDENIFKKIQETGEVEIKGEIFPLENCSARDLKKVAADAKNDNFNNQIVSINKNTSKVIGKIETNQSYNIIVIDPPWPYGTDYDSENRRVASSYPEMSIEKITELKLNDITKEELFKNSDCILWLWTTHKFIWDAKEIMENWGFEYKAILTWDKEKMGMGYWLRMQCEFCLLGIKGSPKWDIKNIRDIIKESRREHSRKPDSFYNIIDKSFKGDKADVFGRQQRKGWDIFGAETKKF